MVEIFLAVYKTNDVRNPCEFDNEVVNKLLQLIDIQNAISFYGINGVQWVWSLHLHSQ